MRLIFVLIFIVVVVGDAESTRIGIKIETTIRLRA